MAANKDAEEILQIAAEIRRYLGIHPYAADTLEGIADWWLQPKPQDGALNIIQQALDLLVNRDEVLRVAVPDGRHVLYACKPQAGYGK